MGKKKQKKQVRRLMVSFHKIGVLFPMLHLSFRFKNDKKKITVTVNICHRSKHKDLSLVFGFFALKRKLMVT